MNRFGNLSQFLGIFEDLWQLFLSQNYQIIWQLFWQFQSFDENFKFCLNKCVSFSILTISVVFDVFWVLKSVLMYIVSCSNNEFCGGNKFGNFLPKFGNFFFQTPGHSALSSVLCCAWERREREGECVRLHVVLCPLSYSLSMKPVKVSAFNKMSKLCLPFSIKLVQNNNKPEKNYLVN